MFAFLGRARKVPAAMVAVVSLLLLASCGGTGVNTGGPRIDTTRPVPVALLVPAGAGNAADDALARSLENAARLAMSELDGVTIDLRVYNTAGNATQAANVAKQAVNDGAKIILGPVYAQNAAAAGVAVAGRGTNVLAFSNNPDIAGGNVFILGSTFQNTAGRLVSYATAQGKGRIMVLYGQTAAETAGRDAILRAIANTPGASQAGAIGFEVSQNGIIDSIRDISGQVQTTGAQSVFFTSGTDGALNFVTDLLRENGVKTETTQYIGLQRWDIPADAVTRMGSQGGWFALPDPGLAGQFESRYVAAYGTGPHPIAGLAYDGIAAIGALVKAGQADALTGAALTQPQGFVGVNGIFRLLGDGTNQRALAVAKIENREVVVIDPAPRSFAVVGY